MSIIFQNFCAKLFHKPDNKLSLTFKAVFNINNFLQNVKNSFFAHTKHMPYFNYHAKTINLIKTGHCKFAEIKQKHGQISPALLLHFDNHIPMPIREHKWPLYFFLLDEYRIEIKK